MLSGGEVGGTDGLSVTVPADEALGRDTVGRWCPKQVLTGGLLDQDSM